MKIIEVADDVTLEKLVKRDPHRSPGLHQSTIIGDLMRRHEPKRFGESDIKSEFIGVGLAFENLLEAFLRDTVLDYVRPGEFSKDGIIITPDAFGADGLEEIKVTWAWGKPGAQALADPKFLRYHLQGKGYCYVLGTNTVTFRVLFVVGEGRPALPVLRTFKVTYSRIEIGETWRQLKQHARDVGLLT